MSEEKIDIRQRWQPQPRPEWVARLNEEGRHLDISGIVPLTEDSLIDAACRKTGLSNFGADDWREPFGVFVRSLEADAGLNLMGRLMTRAEILMWLELRLAVEEEYRLHPEIADEEIVKPVLIVGQGRSGTSALQNLLAADPGNGTLQTWEAFYPSPPPEAASYASDPRIAKADRFIKLWYRVTPELESMHEFGGAIPTEGIHLQCSSFQMPTWLNLMGQIPSYNGWIWGKSFAPALEWEKRVLRVLQWKNPRRTWVMKSPVLFNLPDVFQVYPDACLVWAHRDPMKSLASAINMVGTIFWQRSDDPFSSSALDTSVDEEVVAAGFNQAADWVEQGVIPADQLLNVQYADFVADPMAVARSVYARFGIPLTPEGEASMQRHLIEHAREKRAAHRYEDVSSERGRAAFRRYQQTFDVPDEV